MRVLSFVTQKGGSGKSTLAFNCAVAAHALGKRVLILDMDPQGTATDWYKDREADTPLLAKIESKELTEAIAKAKANGLDLVIIDTPGKDEPSTAAAIRASDLCVIPCRPTPGDMKALPPTLGTVARLEKTSAFVLTQTSARGQRQLEAAKGLSGMMNVYRMLGVVSPHPIGMRNAYQDAQGAGMGVIEFEPDGKAAEEIKRLWAWISKKLEKMP